MSRMLKVGRIVIEKACRIFIAGPILLRIPCTLRARRMELGRFAARSSSIGSLLVRQDLGDLVQMGIDVVGQPFELAPCLAKL